MAWIECQGASCACQHTGIGFTSLLEISPTWTKSEKDDKANPVMTSACVKSKSSNLPADRELSVPSALTQSPCIQACIRGLLKRRETPILEQRDSTRVLWWKEKPDVCSLWREAIFRWQAKLSVLSCTWSTTNQEYTQTKAYRTASPHSLGLRILAEVGQQIMNCHLEGYVKVQHNASLLQTDLET